MKKDAAGPPKYWSSGRFFGAQPPGTNRRGHDRRGTPDFIESIEIRGLHFRPDFPAIFVFTP
jgi:hypothetical protein